MSIRQKNLWGLLALMLASNFAHAQGVTHSYINNMRSSYKTRIFVSQGLEGEYGDYIKHENATKDNGSSGALNTTGLNNGDSKSKWQGYNFSSTLGVETLKFVQFIATHSAVNMRSARSGLESLKGSRLSGGARLVFLAPVANLELGGGIIGTRYDYQRELETSDFYGSGFYYSLGMNYFMTDQVSFFGTAKLISEHSVKGGGNSQVETISTNMTNLGIGFSLWL